MAPNPFKDIYALHNSNSCLISYSDPQQNNMPTQIIYYRTYKVIKQRAMSINKWVKVIPIETEETAKGYFDDLKGNYNKTKQELIVLRERLRYHEKCLAFIDSISVNSKVHTCYGELYDRKAKQLELAQSLYPFKRNRYHLAIGNFRKTLYGAYLTSGPLDFMLEVTHIDRDIFIKNAFDGKEIDPYYIFPKDIRGLEGVLRKKWWTIPNLYLFITAGDKKAVKITISTKIEHLRTYINSLKEKLDEVKGQMLMITTFLKRLRKENVTSFQNV